MHPASQAALLKQLRQTANHLQAEKRAVRHLEAALEPEPGGPGDLGLVDRETARAMFAGVFPQNDDADGEETAEQPKFASLRALLEHYRR